MFASELVADQRETARTVQEVFASPTNHPFRTRPFDLSGQVIHSDSASLILQDDTGSVLIRNETVPFLRFARGDLIHVRGRCGQSHQYTFRLYADKAEKTGWRALPPYQTIDAEQMHSQHFLHRQVSVSGVVASALTDDRTCPHIIWMKIRTPSITFFACTTTNFYSLARLQKLVDAEVELKGIVFTAPEWRVSPGPHYLQIIPWQAFAVTKPPPENPFKTPSLTFANNPHRQTLQGRVEVVGKLGYFVRSSRRDCDLHYIKPVRDSSIPKRGDQVTIAGFSSVDRGRVIFHDAIFERMSLFTTKTFDEPQPLVVTNLYGNRSVLSLHGRLLTTTARITNVYFDGNRPESLFLEQDGNQLCIDLSRCPTPLPAGLEAGSMVSLTGYCIADYEGLASRIVAPHFSRFVLLPRSGSDIKILSRNPWWTPFRLMILVFALAAVLVGSTLWNIMLKRKSETRGKALYEEKINHALAEQKVEERTRLAVELHDSVSQTLTGIALQLDGGEIETAKTMLASCRGELRRCLWDLRSRTFEEKDMTEAVTRTITPYLNGIEATVRFNVPRERLSESVTHAILRIIRELVVNAIRHGQARHLKIAGEMHGATISFSVRDDGCGFDPDKATGPSQGHFGLLGIRERLEDFNGSLTIDSSVGHGAKFTITLETDDETDE